MKGLTPYQLEVLRLALAGNPAGEGPIDFDQLLDRLSWQPSKQSAQFTIRACVAKKTLEKTEMIMRRGRHRVCYRLTEEGKGVFDPRGSATITEPEKSVTADLDIETLLEVEIESFRELPET